MYPFRKSAYSIVAGLMIVVLVGDRRPSHAEPGSLVGFAERYLVERAAGEAVGAELDHLRLPLPTRRVPVEAEPRPWESPTQRRLRAIQEEAERVARFATKDRCTDPLECFATTDPAPALARPIPPDLATRENPVARTLASESGTLGPFALLTRRQPNGTILQAWDGRITTHGDLGEAASYIDALPSTIVLVQRAGDPEMPLRKPRVVVHRFDDARLPLLESMGDLVSGRLLHPEHVVSGIPEDAMAMRAQHLQPSSLNAYRRVAGTVRQGAQQLGAKLITNKADFLKLLADESGDVLFITTHSDGHRIFIGRDEISRRELESIAANQSVNHRTIIFASCEAGEAENNLNQPGGFAQLLLRKGYAANIVAPLGTINGAHVSALFASFDRPLPDMMGLLHSLVEEFRIFTEYRPAPALLLRRQLS